MRSRNPDTTIESVLVIGGGIAGLRVALDIARNGVAVTLVERAPFVGGSMAARFGDETDTFGLPPGFELPKPIQLGDQVNIEVLTLAEVIELTGSAGAFTATIRQVGRYVTDACTQCNRCHVACPVVVPNEYHSGLTARKAIYTPFRDAYPGTYVIDAEHCLNRPPNYMPCQRCVEVCDDNAIHFDIPRETTLTRKTCSVVLATGFHLETPEELRKAGYGEHPDVLTYLELEHLLSPSGPSGGYPEKPSTGNSPDSILYVIHDASRFSTLCAIGQCERLVAREIGSVLVLHPAKTAQGDPFAEYWIRHCKCHVNLIEAELERISPVDDDLFRVKYRPQGAVMSTTQSFDMVVFTTAVNPPDNIERMAGVLGIELTPSGFAQLGDRDGGLASTSKPGIYVAGCACGPKDMANTIAEAKAAAVQAMRHVRHRHAAAPAHPGDVTMSGNGNRVTEAEMQERLRLALLQLMTPPNRL